jgi:hypothetical protein
MQILTYFPDINLKPNVFPKNLNTFYILDVISNLLFIETDFIVSLN